MLNFTQFLNAVVWIYCPSRWNLISIKGFDHQNKYYCMSGNEASCTQVVARVQSCDPPPSAVGCSQSTSSATPFLLYWNWTGTSWQSLRNICSVCLQTNFMGSIGHTAVDKKFVVSKDLVNWNVKKCVLNLHFVLIMSQIKVKEKQYQARGRTGRYLMHNHRAAGNTSCLNSLETSQQVLGCTISRRSLSITPRLDFDDLRCHFLQQSMLH